MEQKLVVGPRPIVWVVLAALVAAGIYAGAAGVIGIVVMGICIGATMEAINRPVRSRRHLEKVSEIPVVWDTAHDQSRARP